jgi:hypothetical protein
MSFGLKALKSCKLGAPQFRVFSFSWFSFLIEIGIIYIYMFYVFALIIKMKLLHQAKSRIFSGKGIPLVSVCDSVLFFFILQLSNWNWDFYYVFLLII